MFERNETGLFWQKDDYCSLFSLEYTQTYSGAGYRERYSSFSSPPPFFLPGFDRRDSICLLCNKHIYQTECIQETEVFLILTTQYAAQGNGMETAGAKQQPQRVVWHNLPVKTDKGTGRVSLTARSGGTPVSHKSSSLSSLFALSTDVFAKSLKNHFDTILITSTLHSIHLSIYIYIYIWMNLQDCKCSS